MQKCHIQTAENQRCRETLRKQPGTKDIQLHMKTSQTVHIFQSEGKIKRNFR